MLYYIFILKSPFDTFDENYGRIRADQWYWACNLFCPRLVFMFVRWSKAGLWEGRWNRRVLGAPLQRWKDTKTKCTYEQVVLMMSRVLRGERVSLSLSLSFGIVLLPPVCLFSSFPFLMIGDEHLLSLTGRNLKGLPLNSCRLAPVTVLMPLSVY